MSFLKDEKGQGAAEYILLFGGVIVIAIVSLLIYREYWMNKSDLNMAQDLNKVRTEANING
jgi:uncharacterized protein (UPF0333 family)